MPAIKDTSHGLLRRLRDSLQPDADGNADSPGETENSNSFGKINNPNVLVSVIINYYAKQSTIFSVLASLTSQSLVSCTPEQIEIIIVDDGTEGEHVDKDLPPRIIYLWQKKPGGLGYGICKAKNTGAKIANGRYLIFLDADISARESYIEACLNGFQNHGDRVVQCAYIWDYFFKGCPDPRTEFGVWENPDHPTRRFYQVAGGSMAISKALFLETNGFDEDLVYGGVEDLLFGYELSLLPETMVYFNRQMECWHVPHPPSVAHADPARSWSIVKTKYPNFYDQYICQELR